MSADLLAFFRARLDEDEAEARTVRWDGSNNRLDWHLPASATVDVGDDEFYTGDRTVAAHIARHDPARVLLEVEAKRRVLRAHDKWCEGRCEAKYPEGGFDAAHYWSIKSLAAVYADHPDYDESWRP
ncbi:hypothetical protein GA0115251_106923 [Streptomyces sp. TverLS-915]|uniref:DUF6221 family protein n=1 Tax=Streptomyces sp. TverLS-915 TaxID=1839763 RepID=UPI00081E8D5C|nr:DUF6221 family protein [Streptomyces sp. TverLS-915]SCD40986.1 hypothetical protein GA0115251_106923 [Streptomyces sp. TverLS-915]